jgi:heptaprenylglyceryl phosphate synthase
MWKELRDLDERISIRIATALADHKTQIVMIGGAHGFTEQELKDRGVLIMTTLGTTAPGQAARRSQ